MIARTCSANRWMVQVEKIFIKGYWKLKWKLWGNLPFFRDNEASIWKTYQHLYSFQNYCCLHCTYLWKMCGHPQFSFWIQIALAKICFSRIVRNFVSGGTVIKLIFELCISTNNLPQNVVVITKKILSQMWHNWGIRPANTIKKVTLKHWTRKFKCSAESTSCLKCF